MPKIEMEYFSKQKEAVKTCIDDFLKKKAKEFSPINPWGEDAIQRLITFVLSGKMLRSGLVCLGYQMCKAEMSQTILSAAAAVEFVQTALLIHDDIIDQDSYRRGLPSIFFQYIQRGEEEGVSKADHFGEGMAICLGDISFFLAFELFAQLDVEKSIKEKVIALWSQELSYVGLAQMQDLYLGETMKELQEKDILDLYHYKTARYSFALPLKTGALLGGADTKLITGLEKCGYSFGLLFQLKDDELGLYGSEEELGKPVGSDLRECKKTLHYHHLQKEANPSDLERFEHICGNECLSLEMVQEVRAMMKKYKIDHIIHQQMQILQERIHTEITALNIHEEHRQILFELLKYSQNRNK